MVGLCNHGCTHGVQPGIQSFLQSKVTLWLCLTLLVSLKSSPHKVHPLIQASGSPGYGEEFKTATILDYGGRLYVGLEKCFECVATNIPYADVTKAVALGGSYEGYLIFWPAGK
jgi:hypothetical protein